MSTANLIKMANQIASYFANEPDQVQAVLSVRNHMQMFWTPGMRKELPVSYTHLTLPTIYSV